MERAVEPGNGPNTLFLVIISEARIHKFINKEQHILILTSMFLRKEHQWKLFAGMAPQKEPKTFYKFETCIFMSLSE